jgi:hypothetical protein
MDSPLNHIWGPNLWTILHSSVERIGLPQHKKLPQEETRIWLGLLGSLRYSLPCPQCKKHFTEYFASNPIQKPIDVTNLRVWLYNLHCQVNIKTNKSNTITIEQIPEIYSKPFNFTHHYNIVAEQMGKSLRAGWSTRDDNQRTIRFLQELKRFYDFF